LTIFQTSLLVTLLGIGGILFSITVSVKLFNTFIIFCLVIGFGLWLCLHTKKILGDQKLKILTTFWIVKLYFTIFLLYVGWIPELYPNTSINWGYDPQRYFQDAWTLIEDDWSPIRGSNFQGVIYYYGAIFYLFGHNPVIPALINSIVTLYGAIFIIKCAYDFMPYRMSTDWTISWILLIPEVLWYDVMTSRETLMAVLIIITLLGTGRYLTDLYKYTSMGLLFFIGTGILAILTVRTSMIIPVCVGIIIMIFFFQPQGKKNLLSKGLIAILIIFGILIGPIIQELIGGYDIDYQKILYGLQSFNNNIASDMEWSENSIGLLLVPHNGLEAILFLPLRMVLYLAAPLPNPLPPIAELIGGSWSAWQRIMTAPTSIFMLLGFPYVLAGLKYTWTIRSYNPTSLIFQVTFWITFIAVAGGNLIIHERYRLMFSMMLFACMWIGYTRAERSIVKKYSFIWFGLLTVGAIFYMGFKFT
jgi:hypothetical protein